jgi:hypothetical protein
MHFIFAAYESGLLEALREPCSREALIEKLQVKRTEILDALLEVGLATKELTIRNDQFRLKGRRSKAIVSGDGDMLAAMIQANATYYSDAYRNAADRMHGSDLGDDLDKIGVLVARASKIVEPIVKVFISTILENKSPMRVLGVRYSKAA